MANETKWTPGPWRMNAMGNVVDANGIVLFATCIRPESPHNLVASSRLIAAAPELYEAAELACLNFKRSEASGNFLGDDDHEAWTALTKALAKARGEA